jgi:hypothetical protein
MQRGFQVIDPGLVSPRHDLSFDEQTRILSHLIHYLETKTQVPHGIRFCLIPVKYLGPPYPGIGLYAEQPIEGNYNLTRLALNLGEQLERHIEQVGVGQLNRLSHSEAARWADVLSSFGMLPDGTLENR